MEIIRKTCLILVVLALISFAADYINADEGVKVNINTSSVVGLESLPGVGLAKANAIVAYRDKSGGFKSIEELKDVNGIGDKIYEKIKDLITLGEE